MTPENSKIRPELFLHDACLPDELKPESHKRHCASVEKDITFVLQLLEGIKDVVTPDSAELIDRAEAIVKQLAKELNILH